MSRNLLMVVASIAVAADLATASPGYYYDDGNGAVTQVPDGDPTLVEPSEWQVRLYGPGEPASGKGHWGVITGATAADVMATLERRQAQQLWYDRGLGIDPNSDPWTYFNPLGPIAVFRACDVTTIVRRNQARTRDAMSRLNGFATLALRARDRSVQLALAGAPFRRFTIDLQNTVRRVEALNKTLASCTSRTMNAIKRDLDAVERDLDALDALVAEASNDLEAHLATLPVPPPRDPSVPEPPPVADAAPPASPGAPTSAAPGPAPGAPADSSASRLPLEWTDFDVCWVDPLRTEYVVRDDPKGLILETTRHKLCSKDPTGQGDGCLEGAPPGLTLWEKQRWQTSQIVEGSLARVLPLDTARCTANEREYAHRGARLVDTTQQWKVGITFPKPREQCHTITAFSPDPSAAPKTAISCVEVEGIGVTLASEADAHKLVAVFAARHAQRGVLYSSGDLVIRYVVSVSQGDSEFADIDLEYENRGRASAAVQFTVSGTDGTGQPLWTRRLGTGRLNAAMTKRATVSTDLDHFPLALTISDVKLCPIDPALADARSAGADESAYVSVCAAVQPSRGGTVQLRRPVAAGGGR